MNERELSLLKAVGEAVSSHFKSVSEKHAKALSDMQENLSQMKKTIAAQQMQIEAFTGHPQLDEKAIAASVLKMIDVPAAPELPDVEKMVADAVSAIELPVAPELPDIDAKVKAAVEAIELPEPKPLPDIGKMVTEAVEALPKSKDGMPGEDGRDAIQVEILPGIDEGKSYQRGTYANHNGGLWRSYQKTTGMNGWECIVDGIRSIDISQDNERTITVTAMQASGVSATKSFNLPAMIYRDIFKEGETYEPGDTVTWGGSLWYCAEKTTEKPCEPNSTVWKLAVKKGRDAKVRP